MTRLAGTNSTEYATSTVAARLPSSRQYGSDPEPKYGWAWWPTRSDGGDTLSSRSS
jgi:hypothetical protein